MNTRGIGRCGVLLSCAVAWWGLAAADGPRARDPGIPFDGTHGRLDDGA